MANSELVKRLRQNKRFNRRVNFFVQNFTSGLGEHELNLANILEIKKVIEMWALCHVSSYDLFKANKENDYLKMKYTTDYRNWFRRNMKKYGLYQMHDVNYAMLMHNDDLIGSFKRASQSNIQHEVTKLFPVEKFAGKMVGIEIECIVPTKNIEKITGLSLADSHRGSFNYICHYVNEWTLQNKFKYLTAKSDGSINGYDSEIEYGMEFCYILDMSNEEKSFANLEKLCAFLSKTLGARVNKSCGLHVHLDQRDVCSEKNKNIEEILKRANRLNNALFGLKFIVPKSRFDGNYCKLSPNYGRPIIHYVERERPELRYRLNNYPDSDRYKAINTLPLENKGTIEVRLHSATLSYEKIRNWVEILLNIMKNPNFDAETFRGRELSNLERNAELNQAFISMLDFAKEKEYLGHYITDRFNGFKNSDSEGSEDEKSTNTLSLSNVRTLIDSFRSRLRQREDTDIAMFINPRNLYSSHALDFYTGTFHPTVTITQTVEPTPVIDETEEVDNSVLGRIQRLNQSRRRIYDTEAR